MEQRLLEASELLRATPATLSDHIRKLQEELREVRAENESLKAKAAQSAMGSAADRVEEIGGLRFLAAHVPGTGMNELRELGDSMKSKADVIVLISDQDGKVNLIAMASDDAVKKGAHAGNLVKGIAKTVGGGGGGRPNMAQAGGKNPAGIEEALKLSREVLGKQVGA